MTKTDLNLTPSLIDRSVGAGPFRHCVRTNWGLAICAKRKGRVVHYVFEDGVRRTIATEYEHLMEPADVAEDVAAAAMAKLREVSGVGSGSAGQGAELPTFEQQLTVFRHHYPRGFAGPSWRSEHRGDDAPRTLKRHRDAAISSARELLDEERLAMLLHRGDHRAIIRSMLEVLRATTLVSKRRLRPLRKLPWHGREPVATALMHLLHGGGITGDDYLTRFGAYVSALRGPRRKIHWSLATTLPALTFPTEHVCVRPKKARMQSLIFGTELRLPKTADLYAYRRVQALQQDVRQRLVEEGLEPADMLDVHDFMALTLRPSAMDLLRELDPDAFPVPQVEATTEDDSAEAPDEATDRAA